MKAHLKSSKHKEKSQGKLSTKKIDTFFKVSKDDEFEVQVHKAELQICAFLAEHNIPFRTVDHLVEIYSRAFPDSQIAKKIKLKRSKATGVVINVIGESEKQDLTKKLRLKKFSLLIDEPTDVSTNKQLAIVVRHFDEDLGHICSKLWELVQIVTAQNIEANAEHVYNTVISTFTQREVPISNIIGFASDGANVMMGERNSVASRLITDCPGVTIMKCICHSISLCANEACKKLPRTCEDLARNIYSFFAYSSKRQCEFVQFQQFTNTDVHKLLHPSATRWLSLECETLFFIFEMGVTKV